VLLTCIPLLHSRCSSSINVRTTFPFLLGIDTPQGGSNTLANEGNVSRRSFLAREKHSTINTAKGRLVISKGCSSHLDYRMN
jgi:hypothetical protein